MVQSKQDAEFHAGGRSAPLGYAVAALGRLARADMLDRLGVRKQSERLVYRLTRTTFGAATTAERTFRRVRAGRPDPTRTRPDHGGDSFDLTPTEDQQQLVEVIADFARERLRPAAATADTEQATTDELHREAIDLGLPLLGIPEELGGIAESHPTMTGVLVTEALAHGDLGLAVSLIAPGAVATAIATWGDSDQQATYLPEFTGDETIKAALALAEPTPLFDVLRPQTIATPAADGGFTLTGVKSAVVAAREVELLVVGALLDGTPALFLVQTADQAGAIQVEPDPSMGARAAGFGTVRLAGARAELLGSADGSSYLECVRRSRLAWCALAVGTGQSVLDYVTPYVKERSAFGEPVAHRQSVAFMVADLAIELQAMRLLTWRAAARASRGEEFAHATALAFAACTRRGSRIGLDGVQLLGGHGYVKEHPVERWYRDLRAVGVIDGAVLV